MPISSIASGRIVPSSKSKISSNKRPRSDAPLAAICRTTRSWAVRFHSFIRSGSIFSSISRSILASIPTVSIASFGVPRSSCSLKCSNPSGPSRPIIETRSSQSSLNPARLNRIANCCDDGPGIRRSRSARPLWTFPSLSASSMNSGSRFSIAIFGRRFLPIPGCSVST